MVERINSTKRHWFIASSVCLFLFAVFYGTACIWLIINENTTFIETFLKNTFKITKVNRQTLLTWLVVCTCLLTIFNLLFGGIFAAASDLTVVKYERRKKMLITFAVLQIFLCLGFISGLLLLTAFLQQTHPFSSRPASVSKEVEKQIKKTARELAKLKHALGDHLISEESYQKLVAEALAMQEKKNKK